MPPTPTLALTLVYIGNFYIASGTRMSCLYTEDGQRYDFGFLQRALAKGQRITIRQATPEEMLHYTNMFLAQLLREKK